MRYAVRGTCVHFGAFFTREVGKWLARDERMSFVVS
jgi:hypothetical protein